ncbi:hypothetical protein ACERK3_00835 [Phycisphaerales bacterium AB-hyl4]|uniref:Adhesin n=1 Tax=Natronomicrosphaera hydrolytica TaxID=3242702 RepID=A0ABV4TZX8_9BACT
MLIMTHTAAEHLRQLLLEADAPEGAAARFVAGPEGLSLHLDKQRSGDEAYEHDGRTVLLVDEQISELLNDRTLDLEETDDGPALTLQ